MERFRVWGSSSGGSSRFRCMTRCGGEGGFGEVDLMGSPGRVSTLMVCLTVVIIF